MVEQQHPDQARVDVPNYTYHDVQAFAHLASITQLLDHREAILAVRTTHQLLEFAPSESAHIAKLVDKVTEIRRLNAEANEMLSEISNSLVARPFQIADIERELGSGPWRGGTGPGHLNEPPANT